MTDRIEVSPGVCHSQPCLKGTRILVHTVIELIESGLTPKDIVKDYYPNITEDDVKQCLHYAASLIKDQDYFPFEKAV